MKTVVFAGPTIGADDVRTVMDAVVLPPVAQGDVYRVARLGPSAIGIIDGYFDGVPSVWHKEILWAIEQGIAVFGSASMGALRAAELTEFGMIGVGNVFEAYRNGQIIDDDEVAVLHAPADLGFIPLSEPMVSVRATVASAQRANVLSVETANRVNATAKSMHYRDRSWDKISTRLQDVTDMSKFWAWLPDGKVDLKQEDAREMLDEMASYLNGGNMRIKQQAQRVERTLVWQGLVRRVEEEPVTGSTNDTHVLNELRLDPERYEILSEKAALRRLAVDQAKRTGAQPDRDAIRALMDRHRRRHNLSRREAMLGWLDENDLDETSYEAILGEAAIVEDVVTKQSALLDRHILSELRWSGAYAELNKRAAAKARVVHGKGVTIASPDKLRMLIWFFEDRLGRSVPDDLESFAALIGLTGRDELLDLIVREFEYSFSGKDWLGSGTSE